MPVKYDPQKHHRRSIRLKGYDYSKPGAYFVTICTQKHRCIFGKIYNRTMILNDAGKMITKWYYNLEIKFPDMKCDAFICMPNHIHFIIIIKSDVRADRCICPHDISLNLIDNQNKNSIENQNIIYSNKQLQDEHTGSSLSLLPQIIQWYKTMTTNEYIRGVKQLNWVPFPQKLWQRNYYEHIIRNNAELNRIRKYILNNPSNWINDEFF